MAEQSVRRNLLKHIGVVEESYPLQNFSPLRSGGVADYFTIATTTVELTSAVRAAIDTKIPYFIMGQAKGILFSDGGFPGLVIQNTSSSLAVARDKSQIVADSGVSLKRLITVAANQGLGGLTDFFGYEGTVGGALYSNIKEGGHSLSSSVRYMTALMPPSRLEQEATIVRHKVDWLLEGDEPTKLQHLKISQPLYVSQPVLLTVLFQLTNVRTDEVRLRLNRQSEAFQKTSPKDTTTMLGPLFEDLPGVKVEELLKGIQAYKMKEENLGVDRRFPNFIRSKGSVPVRAAAIRSLIERLQEEIQKKYGEILLCRYEYLGVW